MIWISIMPALSHWLVVGACMCIDGPAGVCSAMESEVQICMCVVPKVVVPLGRMNLARASRAHATERRFWNLDSEDAFVLVLLFEKRVPINHGFFFITN